MTGWQLVTLLAMLTNTASLVYWQRANEARLDIHMRAIRALQAQTDSLQRALLLVSEQVVKLEAWRDSGGPE